MEQVKAEPVACLCCGHDAVLLTPVELTRTRYRVRCVNDGCGLQTASFRTADLAIDAWNQRATPQPAAVDGLVEALRNMADTVAVYAMPPAAPTRQREQWHQDQWDQIAGICGAMLRQALAQIERKPDAE